MICFRIRQSLFLHAHEPLKGVPRLLIDYHLRRCPACREKWYDWSREAVQWKHALEDEPVPNGRSEELRRAVALRIRSNPPVRRATPTTQGSRLRARPSAALLLGAALLTVALNAAAVFGPSLGAGARRLWLHVIRRPVACEEVPKVNRTPPGGQENPGSQPPPQ